MIKGGEQWHPADNAILLRRYIDQCVATGGVLNRIKVFGRPGQHRNKIGKCASGLASNAKIADLARQLIDFLGGQLDGGNHLSRATNELGKQRIMIGKVIGQSLDFVGVRT